VVGVLVFVVSLPIALVLAAHQRGKARAACAPSCVSAGPSVGYLGWDGSVQGFELISPEYAARFARSNARSLINVSAELRRLLDGPVDHGSVRLQVSITPAPTASSPPPPAAAPASGDVVLDWIARIEAFKGPVARRNALKRALEEVTEPAARRALVLAASKIEASAVLDKVDTLATSAAKRRHLEKAISELRGDDIPDDLQAEELAMLEAALRALE
jgi:hypothetical protein